VFFVSFVVKGFGSPISAKPTLQPSADIPQPDTPPPIKPLLKTNTKLQFDRAVDRTVEALFHVFQGSNRGEFRPLFSFSLFGRQRVVTCKSRAAQNPGSPASPLFGLAGWKFAAPQTVIVPADGRRPEP
jgi:hypothetical protein